MELNLKGTGLTSTLRCSLKCKLCCTFSPYYDPAPHFHSKYIEKEIVKYFEIVNHVEKFTISGGEPFLHEELYLIVDKISLYFGQIGVLEIITNGTIYPSDELIRVLIKYKDKMTIMIDDYGALSNKITNIRSLFDEKGIDYRVRNYNGDNLHCGGWVDFRDLSRKHFSNEEIQTKYEKCAYPGKLQFCFSIMNGEIHPCIPSRRCMELGIIAKNKEEYIDLFDGSISIEEQKQKFYNILNGKSLTACAYCNGLCDDSERFVPAEQL
ncbi:radical SAM protein [Acetobacterium wieringae]|uniref:radical SAM protein n=1 Tax=Acetobacterium wieringae TaxID=52694 RepID=UPI00203333A7|nr:radical SAM protein [Acetobacterium wieringae]URN85412.1 radical SAM protein [Acetobacterium wieringae]